MGALDHQVGQNIRILAQVIQEVCQHHTLDEASAGTLSPNQLKILKIADHRADCTVAEIARLLHVSTAAASKNIERLVQMDLVSRERLSSDRRRFRLELRPSGRSLLDRYDEIGAGKLAHLMQNFEPAEKKILLDLLRRIIRHTLADENDAEIVCLQCAGRCGDDCVLTDSQGTCHAMKEKEVGNHVQPS